MIPALLNTYGNLQRTGAGNNLDMIQMYPEDSSIRLMGMLMTISLGIFAVLFLYVLYNMTANVAGTTIAMLFFIALAFFIILMKTFKLLNRLVSNPNNMDYESQSPISTISEIVTQNRMRQESMPPSYEEAIRNYRRKLSINIMNALPPYTVNDNVTPKPTENLDIPRCSSPQIPVS